MDALPVEFLEETLRLTTFFARGCDIWDDLSGNYSLVSSQMLSKARTLFLEIFVSEDLQKLDYEFQCVTMNDDNGVMLESIEGIKNEAKNFAVFEIRIEPIDSPSTTTWNDPGLLQLLKLSNFFPQVIYDNRTEQSLKIFQLLKERNLRPPGDFGVLYAEDVSSDPIDLLTSQFGNGFLNTISIAAYYPDRQVDLTRIVNLFLTSSVLILNYNGVIHTSDDIGFVKTVFDNYLVFPDPVDVEGKHMIFERNSSIDEVSADKFADGRTWKVEKIRSKWEDLEDNQNGNIVERWIHSVMDVETGRGLRWVTPSVEEIWFF
ncbi:hypothetical protein L596_016684 [Steinernema carpocapsae]|uniref:Uncharacterized protein n=1 Tax=Steinernema carpocapsae TaxID=34508 RepID=A0A4U5NJQ9_STECR|nr:hypothetical protein L596_016684 [Steinernema carpocapsae]